MRIGVIGAGHWGSVLIRNFEKVVWENYDSNSMVYYYDPNVTLNGNIGFGNIERFFDNVDIVAVATPAEFLFENALRALKRGKHVFCEKPILHPYYLDELYSVASINNITFFVDNLYLYNENLRLFGELFSKGKAISHIDIDWYNGSLPRTNVDVFNDLGWHPLNILYAFVGDCIHNKSKFNIFYDSSLSVINTKFSHTSVCCKLSWLDREKVRRINVRTSDGCNYVWDETAKSIVIYDKKGRREIDFVGDSPVINCIKSFLKYVGAGTIIPNIGATRWTSQFVEDVNRIKFNVEERGYEGKICRF